MRTLPSFEQIGADRLAYHCAKAIQAGRIDARSEIGDALLDYLRIGDGERPASIPEWIDAYEAQWLP